MTPKEFRDLMIARLAVMAARFGWFQSKQDKALLTVAQGYLPGVPDEELSKMRDCYEELMKM